MMKKIFIDCGFHHGEGLTHFIEKLGIDHSWEVHCFEPNPECHMLERLGDIFPEIHPVEPRVGHSLFPHKSAVWVHDGHTKFSQENWEISNSGSPKNPCVLDGWASCVTDLNKAWPGLMPPIEVPCIDFSAFLKRQHEFTPIDSQVYCKMDIEGAEFPVLRKLIKDGTINCIKKLWVEFHERYIPGENRQTKAALIRELSLYTEVEEWH